jgi:uncharacterized protein (UPF0147 family)
MRNASDTFYKIDTAKQRDLIGATSFAIGYLDGWLKDERSNIPLHRRDDLARMVTTLEQARDAAVEASKVEVA